MWEFFADSLISLHFCWAIDIRNFSQSGMYWCMIWFAFCQFEILCHYTFVLLNSKEMEQSRPHTFVRQNAAQIVIIIILILTGIFLSNPAEAQKSHRKMKSKKTRQISARNNSNNACYALYKKRTTTRNREVIAATARRQRKYKPMAETDQPKENSIE